MVALGSQALTFVSDCATVGPTVPGGSKRGTLWPANRSAGGNLRCTPEVGESGVSARSRSASTGSRADTPAVSWEPFQAPERPSWWRAQRITGNVSALSLPSRSSRVRALRPLHRSKPETAYSGVSAFALERKCPETDTVSTGASWGSKGSHRRLRSR